MPKNKITSIIVSLSVLILSAGVAIIPAKKEPLRTNNFPPKIIIKDVGQNYADAKAPTTSNTNNSYTLAQVTEHNNISSCWSAINGKIYDLTSWVSKHKGGEEAILSICGIDGSSAFNNQHGNQSKPENILSTMEIGTLITK